MQIGVEHFTSVETDLVPCLATASPMWKHAGKVCAGRVGPFGQEAKPRAGRRRNRCSQRPYSRECFVPAGDVAEQNQAMRSVLQHLCHTLLLLVGFYAFAQVCHGGRKLLALRSGNRNTRKLLYQTSACEVFCDLEVIVVDLAVCEADLCSPDRRLAQAVGKNRRFLANIGSRDQHSITVFDICNIATEPRELSILTLVREVPAPQSVIDICGAEVICNPCQKMRLFDRYAGRREDPDLFAMTRGDCNLSLL